MHIKFCANVNFIMSQHIQSTQTNWSEKQMHGQQTW
jgi:hypothetical protein